MCHHWHLSPPMPLLQTFFCWLLTRNLLLAKNSSKVGDGIKCIKHVTSINCIDSYLEDLASSLMVSLIFKQIIALNKKDLVNHFCSRAYFLLLKVSFCEAKLNKFFTCHFEHCRFGNQCPQAVRHSDTLVNSFIWMVVPIVVNGREV